MAGYKGHIGGGIVLGAAYAGVLTFVPFEHFVEMAGVLHNWQALAAVLVLAVLFALFPDIDTNSKGQNIFYGLALAADIALIWSGNIQAAAYLGLIAMLPIVGKHRGWTHSKIAMLLVPLPILLVPYLYNDRILWASTLFYGAAVVGYFSHLLLDGLIVKWFRIKSKETW
ncbi:MAG TPA: metal-dependent hydrolase [Candidatus Saccharimonadales bacterium]|nr:metal-dependent hydrolase [Candidatus Saccharimonadales bacterium]